MIMKKNRWLFGFCIVIFTLGQEHLLFLDKNEPSTASSHMTCPIQSMAHFSQLCGDTGPCIFMKCTAFQRKTVQLLCCFPDGVLIKKFVCIQTKIPCH